MDASHRTIRLHPHAPPKPAPGAACNGCGVCCASEPCPLGRLAGGRRDAPCPQLRWSDAAAHHRCGLLDARADGAVRTRAARLADALRRALVRRWIAAGAGCDCTLRVIGPG